MDREPLEVEQEKKSKKSTDKGERKTLRLEKGKTSTDILANSKSGSAGASPSRKHPVHGVLVQPDQPTIVCVTVCTKDRVRWLNDGGVHDLLVEVWTDADLWRVGRYVIMPDHIHLFAGKYGDISLDNWVRYWKSQFSKRHSNKNHRWQTDHWDHRVRTPADYEARWNYIYWNPVRAELVPEPDLWPFSGTIHDLGWD